MKDYHLLLACDKHYLPYMFVACQSVLNSIKNSSRGINNDERVIFNVIIDSSVDLEKTKTLTDSFCKRNDFINTKFCFHNTDAEKFANARGWGEYDSRSVYYRLLINRFIETTVSKVLYIDIDILVLGDVRQLIDIDMRDKTLGAVYDPMSWRKDCIDGNVFLKPCNRKLDTVKINESNYFNSGVLLINLERWRNDAIDTKSIDFIKAYNPLIIDQDTLNAITKDNINLDWSWNFQTWMFYVDKDSCTENIGYLSHNSQSTKYKFSCSKMYMDTLRKGINCCNIIHYTYCKPWKEHPLIPNSDWHYLFNEQLVKSLQMWQELARQTPECTGVHIPNTTNASVLGDIANHTAIKLTKELEQIKYKRRKQNKIIISAIGALLVLQIISIFF